MRPHHLDPRGLPVLVCLSLLAAAFFGVTAGLLGVLPFILGLAIGYALRWYTAS